MEKDNSTVSSFVPLSYISKPIKLVFDGRSFEVLKNNTVEGTVRGHIEVNPEIQKRYGHIIDFNRLFGGDIFVRASAVCAEGDTFDENKGRAIAWAKAENKAYKIARRIIVKQRAKLFKLIGDFLVAAYNLNTYIKHNKEYLSQY